MNLDNSVEELSPILNGFVKDVFLYIPTIRAFVILSY